MTDTLDLFRENRRVEWVDPALQAALDWVDATPEADQCPVALSAFCAGARHARAALMSDLVGIVDQYLAVLRLVSDCAEIDQQIAVIETERDRLLGVEEVQP